jgi:chaperonin GroES
MAKKKKKIVKKKVKKFVPVKTKDQGIRPLGSRVLIKPFTKEELAPKNSFGLIMPDADKKEKSEQGVVLAVGLGAFQDGKFIPVSVKVGDIVAFSKYGYDDISVDGEELYLIKEENILAVINK